MWMMSEEERVLTPAEWACIRLGLAALHEYLDAGEGALDMAMTGVEVFDRLTATQKLAVLADTCEALTVASVEAPRLNAINEGTVAAVLQAFWNQLVLELDLSEGDDFPMLECRRALLRAFEDADDSDIVEILPQEEELDSESWLVLFTLFESRFLEDSDYAMSDLLDMPAEKSESIKSLMGIDDEYFIHVPPDPTERQMHRVRQKLARLLGLPVPDDDGRYPALCDRFSGLAVGPCTAQQIADWSDNLWIATTSLERPIWDCEYDVWRTNFAQAILAADPNESAESAQLQSQRQQRREAALQALGAWPQF